jgi:excisionase family DNA binding protein
MTLSPAKFLTTRQLARLWLVSEATIKRWADTGQLTSSRTVGGHRRFPVAEVMRFQTERNLGGSAAGAGAAAADAHLFDAAGTEDQFFDAITEGHAAEATALLLEAHMLGVPLERIFDEVVSASLRRVGDRWEAYEMSVADEHVATSAAASAVVSLAAAVGRGGVRAGQAVCCAAEDELRPGTPSSWAMAWSRGSRSSCTRR